MTTNYLPNGPQGMIPPHARELEEAVLGSCMLEIGALERVNHILDSTSFYIPEHQVIWNAIVEVKKTGSNPDLLILSQHLRDKGNLDLIGGPYYLAQLTNKVSSAVNIEYHARILQQHKASRETIRIGMEMAHKGYMTNQDGLETLSWAQGQLQEVSKGIFRKDAVTYAKAWELTASMLNEPRKAGILTGFRDLDEKGGYLEMGDVTILAARPGMGKTVLGIDIALNVAASGKPAAFFSLEMPQQQLMMRMISRRTGIPLARLRDRELDQAEWAALLDDPVPDLPFWIDDTAQITPMELGGKVASLKAKYGLELVVVDYLQIMRGNGERHGNREAEISSISRDLKAIAKQQNVHIIALAQLSRETEKRAKPEPKLADLRESGSIEQDADNVWFIYRPEYYAESNTSTTLQVGNTGINVPMKGHVTIICDKFRNGGKFRAYMRCDLPKMRFMDGPEGYAKQSLQFNSQNYPEIIEGSDFTTTDYNPFE